MDKRSGTAERWRVSTWGEGIIVEANDADRAIVAALEAITVDGFLLKAEPYEYDEELDG